MIKKILLIIALLLVSVSSYSQTITKGKAGKQDLGLWDGTSTKTFTRTSSTGYTLTLNSIDYGGVDICQVYGGGVNKTSTVLQAAITAAGIVNKVEFNMGTAVWTLTANVIVPANITLTFPLGSSINGAFTLAFSGSPDSQIKALPGQQIFGSTITVTFAKSGIKYANWWGENTTPGTTNMTAAISAAINAGDGVVQLLGETYIVTPDTAITGMFGYTVYTCFTIKDNMHFRGIPGKSILKIADDTTTDVAPKFFNFFTSKLSNTDVSFDGVTFDFNAANNSISPLRPAAYNTYHISAMYWGGSSTPLGKIDNLTVNNCVFTGSPGTNIIVASDGYGAVQSSNVKITNNRFIDCGWDTDDHTTVLLVAKNSEIAGNVFTIPTATKVNQNAIDVHGPYNTVHDNTITDYISAIGITQNENTGVDVHEVDVHDNNISVYGIGIWVARYSSGVDNLYNVFVHDNLIEITDSAYMTDLGNLGSYGVLIFPDLDASKIYIEDNKINKLGGVVYASYGIVIFNTATSSLSEVYIKGNNIDKFTQGISAPGFATNGPLVSVFIENNTVTNSSTATTPVLAAYGINLGLTTETISKAYILNNALIGVNSSDTGVYLSGIITEITYKGNHVKGYASNYVESSLTNTTYYGEPGPILLAEVNVALNAATTTTLYTVPAYRTCSLSHVILVAGADAGASVISIGAEAVTFADFIPNSTLSNIDAANDEAFLTPIPSVTPLKQESYAGSTVIKANVTTALGGATNKVRLYGYLY